MTAFFGDSRTRMRTRTGISGDPIVRDRERTDCARRAPARASCKRIRYRRERLESAVTSAIARPAATGSVALPARHADGRVTAVDQGRLASKPSANCWSSMLASITMSADVWVTSRSQGSPSLFCTQFLVTAIARHARR